MDDLYFTTAAIVEKMKVLQETLRDGFEVTPEMMVALDLGIILLESED